MNQTLPPPNPEIDSPRMIIKAMAGCLITVLAADLTDSAHNLGTNVSTVRIGGEA